MLLVPVSTRAMKPPNLITLTSDFGASSHYVAQMKGVLLGLNPHLQVVDLTHAIAPQRVRDGALVLQQTVPAFPAETCHIVVIDPGVGTDRRIVLARLFRQYFIAPDSFGNLITNIGETLLAQIPPHAMIRVRLGTHEVLGLVDTYADRPPGTLVALVGSGGYLELAQVNGHAARILQAQPGDPLTVTW